MIFSNNGITPLYATNSTSSAYTLTAGIVTASSSTFSIEVNGAFGMWLAFYGVGSNNNAGTFRVTALSRIYKGNSGRSTPAAYYRHHLGSGTWTLSSSLTGDGTIIPASNYLADSATYAQADASTTTPKGIGSVIESAYSLGTASTFSPADDATQAWVFIPFMGFVGHIEVESIVTTATSANVLAALVGRN